jgi:hypothetical protein
LPILPILNLRLMFEELIASIKRHHFFKLNLT